MENLGSILTLKKIQEQGFGSTSGQYTCTASNSKTKRASASAAVSFAVIGESPPTWAVEELRVCVPLRWCPPSLPMSQ